MNHESTSAPSLSTCLLVPLIHPFAMTPALEEAIRMAESTKRPLHLLHVYDPGSFMSGLEDVPYVKSDAQVMAQLDESLRCFAEIAVPSNVSVTCGLRCGSVVKEILKESVALQASAIFLQRGSRPKWLRTLLPGITDRIVRKATTRVLILPLSQEPASDSGVVGLHQKPVAVG